MYAASVCLLISTYICVQSTDGRVIEIPKDVPLLKEISPIDRYWKDVMAFNKTTPLLTTRYLQSNFGPKLVSSALSNSFSASSGMFDHGSKNGKSAPGSVGRDFPRIPGFENSVGQTVTFSRRRGEGFGDSGSLEKDRYLIGGSRQSNAGEFAGAGGGGRETGGSVHSGGQSATLGEAVVGRGRGRGPGGRAGGGHRVGAASAAAASAASGTGNAAEEGGKVQSSASSQAASASQSSNGHSQAVAAATAASSANSQTANGNSTSNSQSMAASASHSDSENAMANSQSMAASASHSDSQNAMANSQSAAFSAASSGVQGQGLAASQAMSSSASFSAGNGQGFSGSQSMSASSSQSGVIGGVNNAFSSSASMSMASSNLLGAEAGTNEFKMNFNTPFGMTNVDEKSIIPNMRWKDQYSRWSRKKSHKNTLISH